MAKGGFGSITCVPFWKGCCGLCTWPIVTLCLAGIEVGDKYKIGEGKLTICFKTCCCFCCYVLAQTHAATRGPSFCFGHSAI